MTTPWDYIEYLYEQADRIEEHDYENEKREDDE